MNSPRPGAAPGTGGKLALGETVDISGAMPRHGPLPFGSLCGIDVSNTKPLVPRKDRLILAGKCCGHAMSVNLSHVGSQRYDNDQENASVHAGLHDRRCQAEPRIATGGWQPVNNLFDKAYYSYAIVNGAFTSSTPIRRPSKRLRERRVSLVM